MSDFENNCSHTHLSQIGMKMKMINCHMSIISTQESVGMVAMMTMKKRMICFNMFPKDQMTIRLMMAVIWNKLSIGVIRV